MESVLIEYFRFDDLDTGVLAKGKRYLLACKNKTVKEVVTQESHLNLLMQLSGFLRYDSNVSNDEKWKTITVISNTIKEIFIDATGYSDCQFDVVLNASELGLLPFELLLDDKGIPYFTNDNKITFTRRIRQESFGNTFPLPVIPKVLFIYAHSSFREVPFEEHLYELDKALEKWGGKSNNKIFKLLSESTFEELTEELKTNDFKDKQYTHVHLLAHGALIQNQNMPFDFEYGIALGKKDGPVTPTEAIKKLFEGLQYKPSFVNFMICDGANFANPLKPDRNPVQVTHRVGVPVVLGSQFPLSMEGSTLITKNLYKDLFEGKDLRKILHSIRKLLFQKKDVHDWISLVAYVRLPEDYCDQLNRISLKCLMQNLKYLKSKTDEYLVEKKFNNDDFLDSLYGLTTCVSSLEERLSEIDKDTKYLEEVLENLGLLGSAYKRIAELYFKGASAATPVVDKESNKSIAALKKAMDYYKKACDKNMSHHWSSVQFLSLDVVLNGQISDIGYWYAAKTSIKNSLAIKPEDGWAYGSLIELLLLNSSGSQPEAKKEIIGATSSLIKIAKKCKDLFLLESTWAQLNRYKSWWTTENGFLTNKNTQITDAVFLDVLLTDLKKGIDELKSPLVVN